MDVDHIIFPVSSIINNPPTSGYSVNATTCLSMIQMVCIAPLVYIESVFFGILPKKYWPPLIDHHLSLFKFDAYKRMFNIVLDF